MAIDQVPQKCFRAKSLTLCFSLSPSSAQTPASAQPGPDLLYGSSIASVSAVWLMPSSVRRSRIPKITEGGSLWAQFAERFFPLSIFSGLLVAAFLFFRSVRRLSSVGQQQRWLKIPASLVGHVLLGGIISVILAGFLGWLAELMFRVGSTYESIIEFFK
jgi:hypothetical protein